MLRSSNLGNSFYYSNNFDVICDRINKLSNYQKNYICIICGLGELKNKLSQQIKDEFSKIFEKNNEDNGLNIILVDTIDKIKAFEYEPWFKKSVQTNYGIWIGNGLLNQFTLKLTKSPREARDEIAGNFGFVIKKGNPTLVKLLEYYDDIEVIE